MGLTIGINNIINGFMGGGAAIPANAVLYEDATAVFYEDSSYLLYE